MVKFLRVSKVFVSLALGAMIFGSYTLHAARIKDISHIKGVRGVRLIGYSLVVGLPGTGDNTDNAVFSLQSIVNMLQRFGIKVDMSGLRLKNIAAVMVTADVPPFSTVGTKFDVLVSSIGDAKSLRGGTLLMTPLRGPDGKLYAIAQGPVVVGGFNITGAGAAAGKNPTCVGRVVNGATLERELPVRFSTTDMITISLYSPDFTTANQIQNAINKAFGAGIARAVDGGNIVVEVPPEYKSNIVSFISKLENISVMPSPPAKVIVNERTGTVVMGENVRILPVAVAQGGLSIVIKEVPKVSQPLPFSAGETIVTKETTIKVKEKKTPLYLIPRTATIGDLVRALNAIGATPNDLISILQAIKAAGALQAELEVL